MHPVHREPAEHDLTSPNQNRTRTRHPDFQVLLQAVNLVQMAKNKWLEMIAPPAQVTPPVAQAPGGPVQTGLVAVLGDNVR